jgi:hypothetical protein
MKFQVVQGVAFAVGLPSLLTILETAAWIAFAILIAELASYFLQRLKHTGNVGFEVRDFWVEGNWFLKAWFVPARRLHDTIPQRTTKLNSGEFAHRVSL